MKYLYTSEIGHHYLAEENTSGHRMPTDGAVTQWENRLKVSIASLRNLEETKRREDADVANRAAPLRPGQRPLPPLPTVANLTGLIATARATKNKNWEWLVREGFALDPDGNIDWSVSHKTVVYDHQLEAQQMTKISARRGRLFIDGHALDTTSMVTHFSGPGYAIYVMSQQGHIHVSSHSIGHRHHSSLLAGGDTAGAGELRTSPQGDLLEISNKSGHYRPSPIHLNQVIHQLAKLGVAHSYAVTEWGLSGRVPYTSASAYLDDVKNRDDSPEYELQKLLAFMPYLNDAVLNRNDWEWRVDPTLAPGVYKRHTHAMVPHKVARQWLKSQMGGGRVGLVTRQAG